MNKKKMFDYLVRQLRHIAKIDSMDTMRKLDQGYGYSQALIAVFPDDFDEIASIYQSWNMAINPAYTPTYESWLADTEKYLVPVVW